MNNRDAIDNLPWYRQFWPWVLIGLPATVVVAGLTTVWIAASGADSLVVDDYYKDGLAINQRLDKEQRARELGLEAVLEYSEGALEVSLDGADGPAALSLALYHPLDSQRDRQLQLPRISSRLYRARVELPGGGRWHWQIEPLGVNEADGWRLQGEWTPSHVDAAAR